MSEIDRAPAPAPTHLTWAKGGTASFLTIADDVVTLRSSVPSPPGSRLDAVLVIDGSTSVTVKIHGSKREVDGSFTLKGRLLVANRALRDLVATLLSPPTS